MTFYVWLTRGSTLLAQKLMQKLVRPNLTIDRRFLKYGLVGGSGVIVDSCVLFILADTRMLDFPIFISKIVAAETAMINNFIWNDIWTFAPNGGQLGSKKGWEARFFKFNIICIGGILISGTVLSLLIRFLGIHLIFGNLIAITAGMIWNFGMNCCFTWRGMHLVEEKTKSTEKPLNPKA